MKCKRCSYVWFPIMATRVIPRTGNTYAVDMGICSKCDNVTSRIHTWSPGDMVSAMLWGQKFETLKEDPK